MEKKTRKERESRTEAVHDSKGHPRAENKQSSTGENKLVQGEEHQEETRREREEVQ